MTGARRQTAALIARAATAVSVHVRRGDYVSDPAAQSFHGTCSPEWYAAVMKEMVARVEAPAFFIFSDDPQWARSNLPAYEGMHFIDPQSDRRDFEDMHLMSLCCHHIIANSSFSWWGAWLNPSPDKQVIAPARWFNQGHNDTQDLLPAPPGQSSDGNNGIPCQRVVAGAQWRRVFVAGGEIHSWPVAGRFRAIDPR